MKVVALELLRGLPTVAEGIKHDRWCTTVRQSMETICGQAHDPLMLLLKRMLEMRPRNRPSAHPCLADQSMSIRQPSPSQFVPETGATATEMSSEQPTEILLSLPDGRGGWHRPTTPQGSSKRLRSSTCSAESQDGDPEKQPLRQLISQTILCTQESQKESSQGPHCEVKLGMLHESFCEVDLLWDTITTRATQLASCTLALRRTLALSASKDRGLSALGGQIPIVNDYFSVPEPADAFTIIWT